VVGKAGPIKPERDAANGRTQAITISEERNDTAWLRSFFFFRHHVFTSTGRPASSKSLHSKPPQLPEYPS
jgi:hypothetical protein